MAPDTPPSIAMPLVAMPLVAVSSAMTALCCSGTQFHREPKNRMYCPAPGIARFGIEFLSSARGEARRGGITVVALSPDLSP